MRVNQPRRILRTWFILLAAGLGLSLLIRSASIRIFPYPPGSALLWRDGKVPSGHPEILSFEKVIVLPDGAHSVTLNVLGHPSYLLFINHARAGGGWDGPHNYDVTSMTHPGKNLLQIIVRSPIGEGYAWCSGDIGGVGYGIIRTDSAWKVIGTREPLSLRIIGTMPLPWLTPFPPPETRPLFPTYAGGDPLAPVRIYRKEGWLIADFGRSILGFPKIQPLGDNPSQNRVPSSSPFAWAWAEREEDLLNAPARDALINPDLGFETTAIPLRMRFLGVKKVPVGTVRITLEPVTGPYPP